MLSKTLADIRRRIDRAGPKGLNENNTKATLIEPLLRELGWNTEDVEEVAREYKLKTRDKPVDYALLVLREAKLFVEAKGLGENLDDRRWANQIMGYAAVAGVEWIVLTDGNEYRIYNTHASVRVEEKLLRAVRISDGTQITTEFLELLAKDQLQTKRIEMLWRAHFVDRQVKAALERLFSRDEEMVLVNHVQRLTKDLPVEEIRGSLRRCKTSLDFPIFPIDDVIDPIGPVVVSGDGLLLKMIQSGVLVAPLKLTKKYKGRDLSARVLRDGTVECNGKAYASLSTAASAARATVTGLREDGRMRATNGWTFWQYKGTDGKPTEIDHLRKQFLASRLDGSASNVG